MPLGSVLPVHYRLLRLYLEYSSCFLQFGKLYHQFLTENIDDLLLTIIAEISFYNTNILDGKFRPFDNSDCTNVRCNREMTTVHTMLFSNLKKLAF